MGDAVCGRSGAGVTHSAALYPDVVYNNALDDVDDGDYGGSD